MPILAKLDPAITTIVSGHTHWAYVCQGGEGGTSADQLLTSAGKNGYFFSDIRLEFDRASHRLIAQHAANQMVGNGENGQAPDLKALVDRYAVAVAPIAQRVIGRLADRQRATITTGKARPPTSSPMPCSPPRAAPDRRAPRSRSSTSPASGSPLPAGDVRYADAFSMMPFGNNLVVMTLTGAQLKTVLEQQYAGVARPQGGLQHCARSRRASPTLSTCGGRPMIASWRWRSMARRSTPPQRYRVVVNNYLASGGDGLAGFTQGTDLTDRGIIDLDALVAWIAKGQVPPKPDRIRVAG